MLRKVVIEQQWTRFSKPAQLKQGRGTLHLQVAVVTDVDGAVVKQIQYCLGLLLFNQLEQLIVEVVKCRLFILRRDRSRYHQAGKNGNCAQQQQAWDMGKHTTILAQWLSAG